MDEQQCFVVRYWVATYEGTRTVWAVDGEQAIAKVRADVRKHMSLAMYYERYELVGAS